MRFRPCIDIHNGKVKQIVGSSLRDGSKEVRENFVSEKDAAYYAGIYRDKDLKGGHIIVLNGVGSEYCELSKRAALSGLSAFRGGMQYGGSVNDENAGEYLEAGASHVIVTSFVFRDGSLDRSNLAKLQRRVGRERIVLDLSCRKREDGEYYVTTDRWQKFTDLRVNEENLNALADECSEFLIHAVDVEGKGAGIDGSLVRILSTEKKIPVTYAGGVRSLEDVEKIGQYGKGLVDFTVGSALNLFGGKLDPEEITGYLNNRYAQ